MNTPKLPASITTEAWHAIGAEAVNGDWKIRCRDAKGKPLADYREGLVMTDAAATSLLLGRTPEEPVLIVSHALDVAAAAVLGRYAIAGPPDLLAEFTKGKHVLILAPLATFRTDAESQYAAVLRSACAMTWSVLPSVSVYQGLVDGRIDHDALSSLERRAEAVTPGLALTRTKAVTAAGSGLGDAVFVRLSDVKPQLVQWLWPGRMALGKLTILGGDPGLGKSLVSLDIAARVSNGDPWPDDPFIATVPGGVVLLNAEDDPADTVRPRLDAARANCSRISCLQAIKVANGPSGRPADRMFDLGADLNALRQVIRMTPGCKLVVIDPISAYLGAKNSHDNADIRSLLAPLAALAAEMNVAVVGVSHFNKGGGKAVYRMMGSIAFVAAARAAFGITKDPQDEQRRLMLPIKNNIGPDAGGLAYRVGPRGGTADPMAVGIDWEPEPVNLTAEEAFGGMNGQSQSDGVRTERDDAGDWLRSYLADGPKKASEVLKEANEVGISRSTLMRAKAATKVGSEKLAFGGGWAWKLPPPREGVHAIKVTTQGPHTTSGEHLGANEAENTAEATKVLTNDGVSTLSDHGHIGDPPVVAPEEGWTEERE